MADDIRFYCYAVADFESRDGGVDSEHCASGFVAKDVCVFNDHRTNAALEQC